VYTSASFSVLSVASSSYDDTGPANLPVAA
jgi:hypothetical protein